MAKRNRNFRVPFCAAALIALVVLPINTARAQDLKPDSPVIRRAIERGATYLENSAETGLGQRALVALTLAKCGRPETHPKIKEAIDAIQAATKGGPDKFRADIYSTSVCIMCLVAVDASRYRTEIETMAKFLHKMQKGGAHGGAWGYPLSHQTHGGTCDTSMTQYALLSLWEAQEFAGVQTPAGVWDHAGAWCLLTQDPNGGFGYQGKKAQDGDKRLKQDGVKHSMTAAGMVGLYIVKDTLGISDLRKKLDDDTPAAFRPFESLQERKARVLTKIPLKYFAKAISDGNRWMDTKYTIDKPSGWQYYYLYALERYESFKEVDRRGFLRTEEGPDWYKEGVRFILKEQNGLDGSWKGQAPEVPSTCFAMLFLLRSTQKNLEKSALRRYALGLAVAGRGIPSAKDVRLRGGKVVLTPLNATPDQVLAIVADAEHPDYLRAREALSDLANQGEIKLLTEKGRDLAALALRGATEVRMLALTAIRRSRNLNQVPLLIYLLRDPDLDIVHAAHKALGFISRRFSQIPLSPQPSEEERQRVIDAWKQWYASIRPDVDVDAFDPFESSP